MMLVLAIVMSGCASPIDETSLKEIDGLYYASNSENPYSGEAIRLYDTGEKMYSFSLENGIKVGEYSYFNKKGDAIAAVGSDALLLSPEAFGIGNGDKAPDTLFILSKSGLKYARGTMDGDNWVILETVLYGGGRKKSEVTYVNGEKDGFYNEWFKTGEIRISGEYSKGSRNGTWTEWHLNGQQLCEVRFEDSKQIGDITFYNETGGEASPLDIMSFQIDSKKRNLVTTYSLWNRLVKNDNTAHVGNIVNKNTSYPYSGKFLLDVAGDKRSGTVIFGNFEGAYTEWIDGVKTLEGTYKDGVGDGKWRKWYEWGAKWEEETYKEGERHGESIRWGKDGGEEYIRNYKNGLQHGLQKQFYDDGKLRSEDNYKNGKRHGLNTDWSDKSGKKHYERNYKGGEVDGAVTSYDEWSGRKEEVKHYKDGKLHGLYTSWHSRNKVDEKGNYINGKKDGLWTRNYWDGRYYILLKNSYANGVEDGISMKTAANGHHYAIIKTNYSNGVINGSYTKYWCSRTNTDFKGKLTRIIEKGEYKNGYKEGVWEVWDDEGTYKKSEGTYKAGNREGLFTYWYSSGKTSAISSYLHGKRDGTSTSYRRNGKKEYEKEYKDGKEDGISIFYNYDGTKSHEEIWKRGRKLK